MSTLRRTTAAGMAWSAVQTWGAAGVQMLVLLVLAGLLDARDFGAFALATACLYPVALVAGQGLSGAIVLRADLDDRHAATAFWSVLVTTLALAAVPALAAGRLARAFHTPELAAIVPPLAIGLAAAAVATIGQALQRRRLAFRQIALFALAARLLAAAVALVLAWRGGGVWVLVVNQLVEQGAMAVLGWLPQRAVLRQRPGLAEWRALRRDGTGLALANILPVLQLRGAELLIGHVLGTAAVGQFALARRIVEGSIALVPTLMLNLAWTMFPRLRGTPRRIRVAMARWIDIIALWTIPVTVLAGMAAPLWVPLALGTRWAGMAPLVAAFVAGTLGRTMLGLNLTAMMAGGGRIGRRIAIEALIALATLATTAVALRWGMEGVAWSIALAPYTIGALAFVAAGRLVPLALATQLRLLAPPVLAGLVAAAAMAAVGAAAGAATGALATTLGPWPALVVAGLTGGATFAIALPLLAPATVRRLVRDLRYLRAAARDR